MSHPVFKKKLLASCVAAACSASMSMVAQAQDGVDEEVVVFGIRGALERSADIKREATGVVDAISAEDMGKFPDTNLAESLQRITGVSIDRVNGEGSNVTVRGFGGGNNLVTLNGRHMPTANVATVGGDQNSDFATGVGRSFDFSNLASEGVSGLEVYKTGRASIPTGGIGATINIKTLRPLENPGFQASVGGKLVNDTGVVDGDDFTPELSGLVSWTNDDDTLGVSVFASYQERNSASRSATVNYWNIRTLDFFMNPGSGLLRTDGAAPPATPTVIADVQNAPSDGSTLVSFPNDSRWHLAEAERERTNLMATLQFKPQDNLTLTIDTLMAENSQEETRNDSTNWFNRPFDQVIFNDAAVPTTVFLFEDLSGVKDMGFEQQLRSVEDTLDSVGFNADWQLSDSLNLNFDFHSSEAESSPNGPNGNSSILISMGAPVVAAHSLDVRSGFPVQTITMDDAARGNGNGVLDIGDLGTQIARTISSSQNTQLDEAKIDISWDLDIGTLDFGLDNRSVEMQQQRVQTQQTMGDWGIGNPGEIPANLIEAYCLACLFEDFSPNASGAALVSFKGNAGAIYNHFSPIYAGMGNAVGVTNIEDNKVEEDITAFYVQLAMEGELADRSYDLVLGLRHEQTDVTSTSLIVPADAIVWNADNDFSVDGGDPVGPTAFTQSRDGDYDHVLPSIDFSIDVTEDVKARASFSKTIARPGYNNLFFADTAGAPNRPGLLGGVPTGTSGNPDLEPLESTNIDLSVEWYYDEASYVSLGYYDKEIENFIGTGTESRTLFGLRDASSGQAGSRSGDAAAALTANGIQITDVTLFTLTAMLDNPNDPNAAVSTGTTDPVIAARWGATPTDIINTFIAEFNNTDGDPTEDFQEFADAVFGGANGYDIRPDANDPLFNFAVQIPVNTETANIDGIEFAWQHFFGETGFGFLVNYTTVNGDVGIDVTADPALNQFALLGLSDSANLSLIYENLGWSARLAWNWRDTFLNEVNRGGDRNPIFVDEYEQLDLNVSYDVTENLVLSLEAINLTGESTRHYGRDFSNVFFMQELDPRYLLGARYTFE